VKKPPFAFGRGRLFRARRSAKVEKIAVKVVAKNAAVMWRDAAEPIAHFRRSASQVIDRIRSNPPRCVRSREGG